MVALIAAISENRVIGKDGKLPWDLEFEKKRFKELTSGNIVVMGRKTFESIGLPLPDRITIVISSTKQFTGQSLCTVPNFQTACYVADQLAHPEIYDEEFFDEVETVSRKNIFFAGGSRVYEEALPLCEKLFITEIHAKISGDAFFPDFDASLFEKEIVAEVSNDKIPYTYVTYTRK